jgi:heptosyltransferase-2
VSVEQNDRMPRPGKSKTRKCSGVTGTTVRRIGDQEINESRVRRILIRATNWVGDGVMSLPALEAVRENFPSSSITVLARPWVTPLFEHHPAVDEILTFRKGEGYLTGLGEMVRVIRMIRKQKFDLAILFQNAFEAALLAYLGGVTYRLGYNTDGRSFLLTHPVIRSAELLKLHQVEYYLSILRAMGWEAAARDPSLYVAKEYVQRARILIESNGMKQSDLLVGLSPGAIFGAAKRWPPERFASIGDWAVERWGAKVLIMGTKSEADICEALCAAMTHQPVNLCGRTSLGEAMGLITHLGFFVTNDSGLMHIAAALGVPTVAIFGSTDHVATGPRSAKAMIVTHDIECAPCLKPECPRDYRCMLSIEPEEVWSGMENLREG